MENVLDYIVLLIIIGISLIGSVAKRRKTQANQSKPQSPAHSDPWKGFESKQDEVSESEPELYPPIYRELVANRNAANNARLPMGSAGSRPSLANASEHIESAPIANSPAPSTWIERQALDFDPESAVVYSEILKPKFDD